MAQGQIQADPMKSVRAIVRVINDQNGNVLDRRLVQGETPSLTRILHHKLMQALMREWIGSGKYNNGFVIRTEWL